MVECIVNRCLAAVCRCHEINTKELYSMLTDSQQRSMQPVNIQHHHSPVMDAARKPQRPKRGDYCDFFYRTTKPSTTRNTDAKQGAIYTDFQTSLS